MELFKITYTYMRCEHLKGRITSIDDVQVGGVVQNDPQKIGRYWAIIQGACSNVICPML